jgi:hypothetical protein
MIVCWLGSTSGMLAIEGYASVAWYGIVTGLMSCGLYSGVKNVTQIK